MLKHKIEQFVVTFTLVTIGVGLYWGVQSYLATAVTVVAFHGHFSETPTAILESTVAEELEVSWGDVKLLAIKQKLESLPWIAKADVYRVWPGKVVIKLTEHKPIARWGYDGLVSMQGHIFYPEENYGRTELPILWGQRQDIDLLVQHYHLLEQAFEKTGLSVKQLKNMPDQGWQAMLDNGLVIMLGKTKFEERLNRFVFAYQTELRKETRAVAYVDMRYTNGLAVGR